MAPQPHIIGRKDWHKGDKNVDELLTNRAHTLERCLSNPASLNLGM